MKKIQNELLLNKYISQYSIDEYFSDFSMIKKELVQYEKGELLYMEGNEIKNLLFVVNGRIEIYNLSNNGNGFTVAYCNPLEFLGDIEYLAEILTPNNVEALNTVTCISIPIETNRSILENDLKFYKFLSKTLVNKTLGICQSIDYNKTPSIEKLKSYLKLVAKNNIIDKNLSEIAQSIGISYRQLMRHMNTLCKEKYILKGAKKGTYILNKKPTF